jgi:cellulose 1,4-beta-cellobiosidase
MVFLRSLITSSALLASFAYAQAPVYGQCGGQGWTGPTTCVSGSTCVYSNPYYSQCLPGQATTTPRTTTTPTTKPNSTTPTTKPNSTTPTTSPTKSGTSSTPTTTGAPGACQNINPFSGYTAYLSPYYAAEVQAAAAAISDSTLKAKALKVASIPTFTWFDTASKVPDLATYLAAAQAQGSNTLVQIVVYDLPDRDCHAKASNGEYSIANGGEAKYQAYIDNIVAQVKKYPSVRVVAVIEPDSLANLVTNLSDPKCSNAADTYKRCTIYAMQKLNSVGVYMYLDAGHAGWLGWSANIGPAASLFASLYSSAGKPACVRGLATNVANYNALTAASPDPVTSGNSNYDESHYINALGPMLSSSGFPAHFIVDQGRSGVQNIRAQWGDWCNIKGAGFGTRPTTSTGNSYIDAIVWIKPGGECDGTSDTSSSRYDSTCTLSDAMVPAPEAGTWFQAYFENLVKYANPSL